MRVFKQFHGTIIGKGGNTLRKVSGSGRGRGGRGREGFTLHMYRCPKNIHVYFILYLHCTLSCTLIPLVSLLLSLPLCFLSLPPSSPSPSPSLALCFLSLPPSSSSPSPSLSMPTTLSLSLSPSLFPSRPLRFERTLTPRLTFPRRAVTAMSSLSLAAERTFKRPKIVFARLRERWWELFLFINNVYFWHRCIFLPSVYLLVLLVLYSCYYF